MKAVVIDKFGGPEEMYYTDVEKPVPQPDEVLVKNVFIGVGKPDYIMRSGICPFMEKKPPRLVVGNDYYVEKTLRIGLGEHGPNGILYRMVALVGGD